MAVFTSHICATRVASCWTRSGKASASARGLSSGAHLPSQGGGPGELALDDAGARLNSECAGSWPGCNLRHLPVHPQRTRPAIVSAPEALRRRRAGVSRHTPTHVSARSCAGRSKPPPTGKIGTGTLARTGTRCSSLPSGHAEIAALWDCLCRRLHRSVVAMWTTFFDLVQQGGVEVAQKA